MLSQKNQAVDAWTLLQVSQVHEDDMYVGEITGFISDPIVRGRTCRSGFWQNPILDSLRQDTS